MKSLKLIYIIYITICFIISLAVFNSIAFAASNTAEPLVKTVTVTLDNVNPPEKFIGHVEAIESVKLIARVTGYLEKVNFKEGSIVKKGSLLYVIEQPPYLAKVSANKALVKQAKADLFKANQKLNRLLSAQPESVPATDLDDAKAQKDYTEGVLNENQANLKLSLIDFDYTTITAPLTGRIGKTMYTEGNFVGPTSEPLAEIVQMDPIRVVFSVSENNIDFIEKSLADAEKSKTQSIISPEITFPDGIKYDLKGSIDFVDN
jgi:membrane fusion protein (multidrug efflux system)